MTIKQEIVAWVKRFFRQQLMIGIFFCIPAVVSAAENGLSGGASVLQDFTDNYLMSQSNPEALQGQYFVPKVEYRYGNGTEVFSINAQGSVERFNRPEFNGEYPSVNLSFKKISERSSVTIDYGVNLQSTRVSEFNDSGTFERVASNKKTSTARALWQVQLNPQHSISISGSHQPINYESDIYADLKNDAFQANWQFQYTERAKVYLGLSLTKYESRYFGNFPVVPLLLQGYLLCPPNSVLVSEFVCGSFAPVQGNAVNNTESRALQTGFEWDLHEQIKFSAGAGIAPSETVQHINVPEVPVQFGQPINADVVFGGARQTLSDSKTQLANIGLEYTRESSSFNLAAESRIQPSSTGTLWKSQSIRLATKHSFSELAWLNADVNYSRLSSLDEKVISASIDRDIFDCQIKYGYRFTPTLITTFSIGYRRQIENANTELVANAVIGAFSIGYTPQEWTW